MTELPLIYFRSCLMLQPASQVELNDLCLYLVNLVCTSCELLHEFSAQCQLSWKGKDNPVTEVDYLIQHFLVERVRQRYGEQLRIVAEEDLSYATCPQFKERITNRLATIKLSESVSALPKAASFPVSYEASQLCIWIDPLDCTQGFISDRKHEVTILVGVSYNGRPICGVIGHPYKPAETQPPHPKKGSVFLPSVYFGSPQLQLNSAFEYRVGEQAWGAREGRCRDGQGGLALTTAIGYRKMSLRQEQVVRELGLRVVRAGGAGYKCLKLINKEVGSLMFIDAKTSKWDTCAGEAIVLAMGGFTATQNLEQIDYHSHKSPENSSGFVFSLFSELLGAVANVLS